MHITKENIHKFINGITMNCNNMGITQIDYIPDNIKEHNTLLKRKEILSKICV